MRISNRDRVTDAKERVYRGSRLNNIWRYGPKNSGKCTIEHDNRCCRHFGGAIGHKLIHFSKPLIGW